MDRHDLLAVGEVAERSGVSVPTVRFYEEKGLVTSVRTAGNQRRFERHVLRRIAVVRAGQRFGLTLAEIAEALAALPEDRPPTKRDWARMSRRWHDALSARIEAMTRVRDGLSSCIGCGCLSLRTCPVYNEDDELSAEGPGPRRWPPATRGD
ncbi:redox-sensitive transcriptional activator SoxR [Phycicoccus sp. CSK15P-2]|uniref:redox-sensitive transcriptional activator SoxR n=1 Tax=Phycicoccus sp. CSK15P-2 TaxID=2807627 RepID=UPI00194EB950|nr:redox-sensitive transcriptional activator SoxR [Phycicoccus sp. CSK15P-2]MBM6404473.1 redox-sensitive transcriptional activator SoxR [Phycicoccus sp. CSK15P-2]